MAMVSPERVLTDNLLFLRTEVIVQTTHKSYYVFIIVIYTRPGVINDPLSQNRSHASFALLDFENECTDGQHVRKQNSQCVGRVDQFTFKWVYKLLVN